MDVFRGFEEAGHRYKLPREVVRFVCTSTAKRSQRKSWYSSQSVTRSCVRRRFQLGVSRETWQHM